ncbi:MAG: hypothetical protein P8M30_10770 [Planctomycetaceae bacterium]|nr:hypothetical protein [Planctomycetaceae bacterium]
MSSTTPSKASSKYVEYDEFVDYQLEKTRSEIKWNDVLTTLAGIATLTLAYLFMFTMLDHWVIDGGFTRSARAIFLFSLVIVSAGWVLWKIVIPWWRKVHALFAARMIEEHVPGLKSNLINLIDLESAGHKPNPSILRAMEKRSAVELSKVDMENVIDRRQLLRICVILLGVVVLFCLYALFSPKPISFLRPLTIANVPVATQTRIVEVKPGDISVLARRSLPVTVTLRDKKPDRVLFHYTTDDESFVNEELEMQPNEEKEGEYLLMFAGENGDGIGQKTTYYVTAGDARSETFTIGVQQVPTATIERIEYRYPNYMELEPRSQFIGAIDAWEGTDIFLDARIGNDVPVKSAVVQFVDSDMNSTGYEEVPLTVIDGNRLQGSWKLEFRNDGTYAREYRILCKSEAGLSEDDPPTYPILIRPDTAPEVGFVDPSGDIERPANAVIPLVYKARDPDFQLRYVTLRVEKEGEELQSYQLFGGQQKAVADRFRWELKPLGLQPGDIVSFALEARDNKQPFGNRRSSQPLKLTITAPAEPEVIEEQLRKEEAEQEPQLQDEQQDAAEENGEEGGDSSSEEAGEESGENTSEAGTEETEGNKSEDNKSGPPKGDQPKDKNSDPQNKQQEDQPKEGDNPTPDDQPKAEPSDTDGMGDESEMPETGEENGKQEGEPNALKNDGTDDAEALEKIIKDQKEKGDQASGAGESGEEQSGEEGGSGAEMPDDEASNDPAQPGAGNGANKKEQKSDDPKNPGNKVDIPSNDETGEESEGPGDEKRPGDPNAKGTGTPEENANSENATKANDPDNIKRKDGTDPSTVPSEDPHNSDNPKKENTDQSTDRPPNAGEEKGNPNSPGAKNQPDGPDRPDPGEGDPKEQRSKNPDSGETGSSQQASDGQKGGTEKGNGESTEKPGDTAENPEGKPGGKPGEPMSDQKQSGEGKPGSEKSSKGEGKGESSGEGSGSGEGKGDPKGELGEGSAGGIGTKPGTNGGGAGSSEAGPSSDSGKTSSGTPEEQNLDHAKQAADLVLKRLEQQLKRGEVSDELLDELGWTEGQMRAFADRMRQQLAQNRAELTNEEQIRQRQFEEMLKNMNFQPKEETSQSNNSQLGRATRSFGSRNIPVPIEYRDAYEAFTRELGRKK